MSKYVRIFIVAATLLAVLLGVMLPGMVQAQGPVTITWFVGLGTGSQPQQEEGQLAVVDAFNEAHDDIELEIVIVDNNDAPQTLATLLATGEGPDIIGPVGFSGTAQFLDNLLDIQPLVDAAGYDLDQFDSSIVDFNRLADVGLVGLPFATFPAFLYYRPAHFEEAGLEEPPAAYGDAYMLDGEEVEWNIDTMTEVALRLTVDANGYDATEAEFDSENVVQFGFHNQWTNPRQNPTLWGSGSLVQRNDDGTFTAVMPDNWRVGFNWVYDAIWDWNISPNAAQNDSDLLNNDNAFASGNVSMAQSHLWYTCCLGDDTEWQAGALPSYNGEVTVRLHADTFRILNSSDNPEEAFVVLDYLTGEASLPLFQVYGGMPARVEDRDTFFAALDESYPQGVNWDVATAGLAFTENPSHEEPMPNNNEAFSRLVSFESLFRSEGGLDMDAEIDLLLQDLTAIFNAAE
jgi:multiple sugar transport system substrate-binding protein